MASTRACTHLEGAEASRELESVVDWPGRAGGEAAIGAGEVVGTVGEAADVRVVAADEHAARVVVDMEPLVEVECQRVRLRRESMAAGGSAGGRVGRWGGRVGSLCARVPVVSVPTHALETRERRRRGAQDCGRAEGAVDVKPQAVRLAERSDGVERVDGAHVDGARGAHDEPRPRTRMPIRLDQAAQLGHVHGEVGAHGHQPQGI